MNIRGESQEILDRLVQIQKRLRPSAKKVKLDEEDPFTNIFMNFDDKGLIQYEKFDGVDNDRQQLVPQRQNTSTIEPSSSK